MDELLKSLQRQISFLQSDALTMNQRVSMLEAKISILEEKVKHKGE